MVKLHILKKYTICNEVNVLMHIFENHLNLMKYKQGLTPSNPVLTLTVLVLYQLRYIYY